MILDDQTYRFLVHKGCARRGQRGHLGHAVKTKISPKILLTDGTSQQHIPKEAVSKNEGNYQENKPSRLLKTENCHDFGGAAKSMTGKTDTFFAINNVLFFLLKQVYNQVYI